jgi:signal transduction histidine kinase
MTDDNLDRVRKLRHDVANPLAALLAEVQLLLLTPERMDAETAASLKEVERLALRMRDVLKNS